jgi:hypothetical protein
MTHFAIICVIKRAFWWIFPSQIRQMPINIRFSEKNSRTLGGRGGNAQNQGAVERKGKSSNSKGGGFGFGFRIRFMVWYN